MKPLLSIVLILLAAVCGHAQLVITNVFDGPLTGGTPKGVELYAISNINDLSEYGIASANNGEGSSGIPEFTFPVASVPAGSYIYVATEEPNFTAFFGFAPDYVDAVCNINGDDAIEVYHNGSVIDVFGEVDVDGTGQPWEYLDGWASRVAETGPDGSTFNLSNWIFSGVDALDNSVTNETAESPVPIQTYSGELPPADHEVTVASNFFDPDFLIVDLGDEVEWINVNGTHNVNGRQSDYPDNVEDFYSGAAEPAPWTFRHTFTNPGYSQYQCDPHLANGMVGAVLTRARGDHYINVLSGSFEPMTLQIEVGETVVWTNASGIHNVNGSTATFPNNPDDFFSGNPDEFWTYAFTFTEPGLYAYQCDLHASNGMVGAIDVISPYQQVSIPEVKTIDAEGRATWEDSLIEISGVVFTPDFLPNGIEFFIADENNKGVMIRTGSASPDYQVTVGDEILVRGVVDQFNGLIQIVPDAIAVVSTSNTPAGPDEVTLPSEDTEGAFIRINGLTLIDAAQWPAPGQSSNVYAYNGSDTVLIRIDGDLALTVDAPVGEFDVLGAGSQFDNEAPYHEGYQILPRYDSDFIDETSTNQIEEPGNVKVYPNPMNDILQIESKNAIDVIKMFDEKGALVLMRTGMNQNIRLDVGHLNKGAYMVHVQTREGVSVHKMIK